MNDRLLFRIKMPVFDFIQRVFLALGAYIRPAGKCDTGFIFDFISPKECGIELVMVGDGSDGTYVLPDDLDDIQYCFSPGVGPSCQFEQHLYDRYKIRSHLIDASVSHVPSTRSDFFDFEQRFLGACTFDNYVSIEDWVAQHCLPDAGDEFVLQMDIEGAEFSALLACPRDTLLKFRIIALEVHFLDAMNLGFFMAMVEQTFRKLDADFQVCFARANDCCGSALVGGRVFPRVLEITLIRKDRVRAHGAARSVHYNIRNL